METRRSVERFAEFMASLLLGTSNSILGANTLYNFFAELDTKRGDRIIDHISLIPSRVRLINTRRWSEIRKGNRTNSTIVGKINLIKFF